MSSSFNGFPADFMKFFAELAKNNDREWFAANKPRYEANVKAPLVEFIEAMDGPLTKVSDCFVADSRSVGGSMFRIYRDVRFAKDKSPYKEHAACQFRHMAGKDAHAPGFYVHFEPSGIRFGGGIWSPPTPILRQIREAIIDDADGWKRATRSAAFKKRFGSVLGNQLKRAPSGMDPEQPDIEDLRRKSFFAMQSAPASAILKKEFVREVAGAMRALSPFMEFLTRSVGLSYSLDD
jgi:uncharacterized protein (TIGR02453 family)